MENKKITRTFLRTLPPNSPQYVYYHGLWKQYRGKNLSAVLSKNYINASNPQKAFEVAKSICEQPKRSRQSIFGPDGRTNLERFLGLPNPNDPPWPGAQKVPHTYSEWY